MDPLTPATSTLAPAISHIAETAATLSRELSEQVRRQEHAADVGRTPREVQTVRWVLDAPRRFQQLLAEDGRAEAEDEWKTVRALLDKWSGVDGASDVKRQCERVLGHDADEDSP
jgi:vacuolar protein sorting-associated protein 51